MLIFPIFVCALQFVPKLVTPAVVSIARCTFRYFWGLVKYIFVSVSVCPFDHLSVSMSTCPFVRMLGCFRSVLFDLSPFVRFSFYLFVRLSAYPFVRLPFCPFVCLLVCP